MIDDKRQYWSQPAYSKTMHHSCQVSPIEYHLDNHVEVIKGILLIKQEDYSNVGWEPSGNLHI